MTRTEDIEAVKSVLARLTDAWARHDADAYGAQFTEDATYTTFVGTHYRGRSEIAESHRALWGRFLKGTRLADEIVDIRFYGNDVAIVTTNGDTYNGRPRQRLRKAQTYTLVRGADGGWLIAAFHNTKNARLMEAISFKMLPATVPADRR